MPAAPLLDSAGITALGLVAGVLTTVAFLPQVLKTWRSRSARDISLGMFVLFGVGLLLWIAYGLLTHALPVILANGVTLVLVGVLVGMKLRFG